MEIHLDIIKRLNLLEPNLIPAGDLRLKLGYNSEPCKVDARVLSEQTWRTLMDEIASLQSKLEAAEKALKIIYQDSMTTTHNKYVYGISKNALQQLNTKK